MTPEEKDLINLLIDGVHKEIVAGNTLINQKLDSLNEKVTKQNSRVGKLEDFKVHIAEDILPTRVTPGKFQCAIDGVITRIETLEKKLEDAMFFIKHPKIFIGILVIVTLLTLGTFIEGGFNFLKKTEGLHIDPPNTEIVHK